MQRRVPIQIFTRWSRCHSLNLTRKDKLCPCATWKPEQIAALPFDLWRHHRFCCLLQCNQSNNRHCTLCQGHSTKSAEITSRIILCFYLRGSSLEVTWKKSLSFSWITLSREPNTLVRTTGATRTEKDFKRIHTRRVLWFAFLVPDQNAKYHFGLLPLLSTLRFSKPRVSKDRSVIGQKHSRRGKISSSSWCTCCAHLNFLSHFYKLHLDHQMLLISKGKLTLHFTQSLSHINWTAQWFILKQKFELLRLNVENWIIILFSRCTSFPCQKRHSVLKTKPWATSSTGWLAAWYDLSVKWEWEPVPICRRLLNSPSVSGLHSHCQRLAHDSLACWTSVSPWQRGQDGLSNKCEEV